MEEKTKNAEPALCRMFEFYEAKDLRWYVEKMISDGFNAIDAVLYLDTETRRQFTQEGYQDFSIKEMHRNYVRSTLAYGK